MDSVAAPGVPSPRWRLTLFRVLATLLGLVYLPGALLMAAPWAPSSMATALPPLSPLIWAWAQAAHPDLQRWTFAISASVDEAIAVILLVAAWRPLARPVFVQFVALAFVVDLGANIAFDPEVMIAYASLLLLLVVYPEPRRLLTRSGGDRSTGPSSRSPSSSAHSSSQPCGRYSNPRPMVPTSWR